MSSLLHESETTCNTSYLHPRVLSILARNFPNEPAGTIEPEIDEEAESHAKLTYQEDDKFLRVFLRVKKADNFENLYQIRNNKLLCKVPDGAQCIRNYNTGAGSEITKTFEFSKIFGPQSNQCEIFSDVIQQKVMALLNGINCTLLAYGASGSGKTFTIMGSPNEPGIVPRALEYLFCTLPPLPAEPKIKPNCCGGIIRLTRKKSCYEKSMAMKLLHHAGDWEQHLKTYSIMQEHLKDQTIPVIEDDISDVHLSVWISFAEIYNEYVYDLLTPVCKRGETRKKLRLGYYKNNAYIKDLECISVRSASDAYCLLQYGLQNLNYASTSINDHSSRSHSIFTIKLAQASDTKEGVSVSCFNFCDLAGTERVKHTNNVGDRLKESNNINSSLLVLGRCINAIRDSQKSTTAHVIPFRDSKLTQLFQNALSGNESISMIVTISPIREMFDESQHVLNFSAIAKDVVVEQQQLIKRPKNKQFAEYWERTNLQNSTILEESVSCNVDEVEEAKLQLAFICSQIEKEKLDYAEERNHIINTYKNMISNTNEHWEARYQQLQQLFVEKRDVSVISIDSSSDEDESNKQDNIEKQKMQDLRDELRSLKQQYKTDEVTLESLTNKNANLQKTLQDAADTFYDMQCQYKEEVQNLNSAILEQEDVISDLNGFINSHNTKEISNDTDDRELMNVE